MICFNKRIKHAISTAYLNTRDIYIASENVFKKFKPSIDNFKSSAENSTFISKIYVYFNAIFRTSTCKDYIIIL